MNPIINGKDVFKKCNCTLKDNHYENGVKQKETVLHVEVVKKRTSHMPTEKLKELVEDFINIQTKKLPKWVAHCIYNTFTCHPKLHGEVEQICFEGKVNGDRMTYIYSYEISEPFQDEIEEGVVGMTFHTLPSIHFEGLWNSLIYDNDIKTRLLDIATTSILLADRGVSTEIVTCNRMLLLHGPPGTGKTSLCKALSNKLAIRLSNRFTSVELMEINSHSLFSKWFSESGKLVSKSFARLHEMAAINKNVLLIVLIDEVESLAMVRQNNSNEPGDAIRVVNALLTQLDQLKCHSNVLVLATSNVTKCIDEAFTDRADYKAFIGNPSAVSTFYILRSTIEELIRCDVIEAADYEKYTWQDTMPSADKEIPNYAKQLHKIAHYCDGFSGRSLRKLPIIALANCRQQIQDGGSLNIDKFLTYLEVTIFNRKNQTD